MHSNKETVIELIAFLARDESRFERFVSLTGLTGQDVRNRIDDPVFHASVLDYALQDQTLVLEFAADHNIKPDTLLKLRQSLARQEHSDF